MLNKHVDLIVEYFLVQGSENQDQATSNIFVVIKYEYSNISDLLTF